MEIPDISKITLDKIQLPSLKNKRIELDMLRLDKIHPVISGNKWFKLKYHLENFHAGSYKGILTFGGAWSNHIVATACACFQKKIPCAAIIRGEKTVGLSFTLQDALNFNMTLSFIPRKLYSQKKSDAFQEKLKTEYPGYYLIPEGGAGPEGEKGAGEILNLTNTSTYSHIACAIGTSTMFNGIKLKSDTDQKLIGIPVIKGFNEIPETSVIRIFNTYHFGGYAKRNSILLNFMNDFYHQTGIPTDFVYTGKMVYAITDLFHKDFFPYESKILMIHSGGLQGNASLPPGTLIF